MRSDGAVLGMVGALKAFPRRLAARAVAARGGQLRRGVTRHTSAVVLGRTLLERQPEPELAARVAALRDSGVRLMSENGLLRWLKLREAPASADLSRRSLIDQSGLPSDTFDLLALFDAFETDAEPFSFRDLILARKYAGLVAGGASWLAIARSVHRIGEVASLTALSLHPETDRIYVARSGRLAELDGQELLDLEPTEEDADEFFALAENAEQAGLLAEAEVLYGHCLAIDRSDSIAAYNRGNCLRQLKQWDEAAASYALAIKLDPNLVEAWFNHAGLLRETGRIDAARRHLSRAIAIDADYADPVFDLATLEYEAGNLSEARRWWRRYLELDPTSEWAARASRGIAFVDMALRKTAS
ncbi:MAG TPA: tetratricopeptide repeat protein [Alphaproteobacteria bacterium]|nr:tetratricopeptide repeat protein [Alphaproteobacteria bacterium]